MTEQPAAAGCPPFYDSAAHVAAIPTGADAALYRDGAYAVTKVPPNIGRHHWITVRADWRTCTIIDLFEQPWWSPGMLRAFVRGRRSMAAQAYVYTDMSAAAEQLSALRDWGHGSLASYPGLFWWIATLDGIQRTAADLSDELATRWDADIRPDAIWAQQWRPGPLYDTSHRFLGW